MFSSNSFLRRQPARVLLTSLIFTGMAANGAPPAWWSAGDPPAWDQDLSYATDVNKSVANIGQAKHMVQRALETLESIDEDLADEIRTKLTTPQPSVLNPSQTNPAVLDLTVPSPKTPEWIGKQKAPLLIGQLKAIAKPFYDVLHATHADWLEDQLEENQTKDAADPSNHYPWSSAGGDDQNKAPAVIGQLKAVFSLEFAGLVVGTEGDADGDGLPDSWEILHGLNPNDNGSGNPANGPSGDGDNDGVTNEQELAMESNPNNADTNNDGLSDGDEYSESSVRSPVVWRHRLVTGTAGKTWAFREYTLDPPATPAVSPKYYMKWTVDSSYNAERSGSGTSSSYTHVHNSAQTKDRETHATSSEILFNETTASPPEYVPAFGGGAWEMVSPPSEETVVTKTKMTTTGSVSYKITSNGHTGSESSVVINTLSQEYTTGMMTQDGDEDFESRIAAAEASPWYRGGQIRVSTYINTDEDSYSRQELDYALEPPYSPHKPVRIAWLEVNRTNTLRGSGDGTDPNATQSIKLHQKYYTKEKAATFAEPSSSAASPRTAVHRLTPDLNMEKMIRPIGCSLGIKLDTGALIATHDSSGNALPVDWEDPQTGGFEILYSHGAGENHPQFGNIVHEEFDVPVKLEALQGGDKIRVAKVIRTESSTSYEPVTLPIADARWSDGYVVQTTGTGNLVLKASLTTKHGLKVSARSQADLSDPNQASISGAYYLERNTNDDNLNENWDKDDTNLNTNDDDLKPFYVTPSMVDSYDGTLTLEVTKGSSKVRLWKDQRKQVPLSLPLTWTYVDGQIQPNSPPFMQFYVEGVESSSSWDDVVEFKTTLATGHSSTFSFPVVETDVDIDSDNNEGAGFSVGSDAEDKIEDSMEVDVDGWPTRPGKFVVVNKGNTDGVPNWADGFNVNPDDTEDDILESEGTAFVEVLLERSGPFSDDCEVMIQYDASDPEYVDFFETTAGPANHPYSYVGSGLGCLRLWKKSASSARDKKSAHEGGDYIDSYRSYKWSELSSDGGKVAKLYLEAVAPSKRLGGRPRTYQDPDWPITITMQEIVPGRDALAEAVDVIRVTALEVNSSPIHSASQSLWDGVKEEPINPSGVGSGSNAGYFEVDVKPPDYPDSKIEWKAEGSWSTSATGKFATISGDNSGDSGKVKLDIEGLYTDKPEFRGHSLPTKVIKVKCIIVRDGQGQNPPIDVNAIDPLLAKVNKLWRPAGIIFEKMATIEYVDNQAYWQAIDTDEEGGDLASLYNVNSDEVEVYFVNSLPPNTLGINYGDGWSKDRNSPGAGLIVRCDISGGPPYQTLAHELGHAMMLDDIYSYKDATNQIFSKVPPKHEWNPQDWNGADGVGPGYYPEDAGQRVLINRLLMQGTRANSLGELFDLPAGNVYGYDKEKNAGMQYVGLESLILEERTTCH